jgi:hypothetical protein
LQGHRENIAAGHSRFVVLRGFENLHKFSAYTFWFKAISTPWQLAVSRVISTSLKEKKQERVGKTSKRERESSVKSVLAVQRESWVRTIKSVLESSRESQGHSIKSMV